MSDYRASLPPKLSQTRTTSGGARYPQAQTSRQGMHPRPTAPEPATKNIDMQPAPGKPAEFPNEESGMNPDVVSADTGHDAQDQATLADPIACETTPTEVIPTTATAPADGGEETKPVVDGVENEPVGSVSEARYPALTEEAHPVGFPGKAAR